ncbi:MAG: helix-turn-helix domain-containing protein [Methylococcaceae bacterium]|nr:helix-turn-helix domain-containing protein [Prolixibacteraceae bacterium]
MEDRIKKLMDYMGITASELADSIGVQRSNVTHVLKGRNKPSFQFIEKLLQIYPTVNAKWLLLGEGAMIEGAANKSATLFDTILEPKILNKPTEKVDQEPVKETPPVNKETFTAPSPKEKKEPENELAEAVFGFEKPIERLIVFYKDQTFKVYNPSR